MENTTDAKMATEIEFSGSTEAAETKVIAEKSELRKNLNAYALMAYVAVSDRNAMAERLKGLDHLGNALTEVQEQLKQEEERSNSLQLEIWRNEAFVTRSRLQLKTRENEMQTLHEALEKCQLRCKTVEAAGAGEAKTDTSDDVSKSSGLPESKPTEVTSATDDKEKNIQSDQKDSVESSKPSKSGYVMEKGMQIGVSREVHEIIVQENLHLKNTLQQLLDKQGASLKDLTDTITLREIIKQLKRKIGEKEDELKKVNEVLEQAASPKEKTAKKLLDMEAKLKAYERTVHMKHVMIEALSSRCEELSVALETSQDQQELRMAYVGSAFVDSNSADALPKTNVDQVLPSVEIKKLTKENTKLKKLHEHQVVENDALRRERDTAQVERNESQRKLRSLANLSLQPCGTCKDYKDQRDGLNHELASTKNELHAAMIQADTYKTDFHDKCEEMDKVRATHRDEVERWKRNCHALSAQTERFKKELEKQTMVSSELQAESNLFTQQIKQHRDGGGLRPSMGPGASMQSVPSVCRATNPWQESSAFASMPSEVAVGSRDHPELASPQEDSTTHGSHQWTTARPSGGRRARGKLQCMHCHREFPAERLRDFEEHQRRCMENS